MSWKTHAIAAAPATACSMTAALVIKGQRIAAVGTTAMPADYTSPVTSHAFYEDMRMHKWM